MVVTLKALGLRQMVKEILITDFEAIDQKWTSTEIKLPLPCCGTDVINSCCLLCPAQSETLSDRHWCKGFQCDHLWISSLFFEFSEGVWLAIPAGCSPDTGTLVHPILDRYGRGSSSTTNTDRSLYHPFHTLRPSASSETLSPPAAPHIQTKVMNVSPLCPGCVFFN